MKDFGDSQNEPVEILIAEDSPTQAQRLQHILQQQGYSITIATNGHLALEAAQQRRPTLIISDVIMPEMDGYELCQRVKAEPALADVPVILVTTLSDPQDVIRGLECRADNFILKPYDERYLLNRVQFVLINCEMRQNDQPGMGIEIFFDGQKHFITADRLQILNLLLSTYEAAMQRNRELTLAEDTLRGTNSALQELTAELEQRVGERTEDLERINQALRHSEARVRLIIDTALDAVVTIDDAGTIRDWNAQAEVIFGWNSDEALGKQMVDLIVPPQHREAHMRGVDRFYKTGHGPLLNRRIEITALRKDGSEFPIELSIAPVRTNDTWNFSAFARDITERRRAEQKLTAQVERLSLLQQITHAIGERHDLQSIFQVVIRRLEDHLPADFICVCKYDKPDNALTITSVGVRNQMLALELASTDYARVAVDENGLTPCMAGDLVYETEISNLESPFAQRLAGAGIHSLVASPLQVEREVFGVLIVARREANSFSENECEFLRQLTEHVALAAHQAQLHRSLQQAYDDLRQTQQFVMQQERLRALGQMASGVAHDINNAISPIALYTEALLERESNLSSRGRAQLETIQRAIDDVAETVARMREFYREPGPQLNLAAVELNHLVEQAVEMTRARWCDMPQQRGVVIEMSLDLAWDLPLIMGIESEIRETLTNLIFNAVDAMPEGGKMTLRTGLVSSPHLEHGPLDQRVKLEVVDTGVGMDEETQRRCLEPFFTSKGERGTGLGLAMVYGMVERHGAEIEVVSAPGEGTTIRLIFAQAKNVTATTEQPARVKAVEPLRILIVDDDPLVLSSLRDTLSSDGHTVVAVNGGQEGIDTFRAAFENNDPFAVVITDLGMPFVDGRQVASAVKSLSPETRIILFTGWGQRLVADNEIPSHVDFVLSKPPKLHDLRQTLAQVSKPTVSLGN
ncbi:MAG TPA: response regulator [Pyrinomonadaceae bacterium]|jgi:PAS domain S-box-containing protein|nr:response regulator [Pyrinomonadaceae bacterium]